MSDHPESQQFEEWRRFWKSEQPEAARKAIKLPSLFQLWKSTLEQLSLPSKGSVLLELGAAAGSVSRIASQIPSLSANKMLAFDASIEALALLQNGESAVVGDIRRLPFATHCAKLVTSQFAVEYVDVASMLAALDCVAPGGYFVYVLHLKQGAIDIECGINRDLVQTFINSDFLSAANRLLCSALDNETDTDQRFKANAFKAALGNTESALLKAPECQGRDTLLRVYNAVADMIEAPAAFSRPEVVRWFDSTSAELASYVARMSQMQNAALSEDELSAFSDAAIARGFTILREGAVFDRSLSVRSVPIAFHIVGRRDQEAPE